MTALLVFTFLALAAALMTTPVTGERWLSLREPSLGDASRGLVDARGIADVPLLLELTGAALDAGMPLASALRVVAGVAEPRIRDGLAVVVAGLQIGASWHHAWQPVRHRAPLDQLYSALSFAALSGAPSAALLYAEAEQRRRQTHRAAEKRAGALGVKLVVPLGLCSLPAFICLGVVPVVLAMIPAF